MIYFNCKFKIHRIIILAIVFFLIRSPLSAQYRSISVSTERVIGPDLLFDRFYSSNGLPDDRIRSIFQDSKGFLWIGTMNGVCKYDGYKFIKYYKNNKKNSISGNWAYAICEDKEHNIWIGTKEGLSKFDSQKETFCNFQNEKGNPSSLMDNIINTLQFDKYGKLWIGTPKGLTKFDPNSQSFIRFNCYPFNINVSKIIKSYGDFIWIATHDGAVHYNVASGKYQFYKIPVKSNSYGDKFWSMLEENKDLFLTTGKDGLIRLTYNIVKNDYNEFEYINTFSGSKENLMNTEVFDICKSNTGVFWLATGKGLAKIQQLNSTTRNITFYRTNPLNNQSISNNQVFKVFIDETNVLWCGTELGLNKLDLHLLPFNYFTFTDKNAKDQIRSISSKDGLDIWLGTSKSGLYKYNISSGLSQHLMFSSSGSFFNCNRSLFIDNNQIWAGTLSGVINLTMALGRSYKQEMEEHAVFALLKDSKENLWIGAKNGLYKITKFGKKINYLSQPSISENLNYEFVRAIYEDHNGIIWIGFENGGLSFLNQKTGIFTPIRTNAKGEKVFGSTVFAIIEYPENVIWVGTESGLNKITILKASNNVLSYSIKNYFEENGLLDKSVNGLIADDRGNLWISTIKGLVKFNIKNELFQNYLSNINFNPSCYYKFNNHCFLFGSTDGFVMFDPAVITTDTNAPRVVIADLKLFNKSVSINEKINGDIILKKSISDTKQMTLNYHNNQFTLDFTALHFSNPKENMYSYKMEGFDKDWIPTNSLQRSATYTNLNDGTYTFLVKASNYSGKWSGKPVELRIIILPPPWKSWWAILLYFILFNVLLYIIIRYFIIQTKQHQQIEFEQKEIKQLKSINQMKIRFFTDVSHEFRTPLSLIVGPVEELLSLENLNGSVKSKVQLIYRNAKKLLYLIEELMTFQKMESGMLKLKPMIMDIVSFIKEVHNNFLTLARTKDITFNLEVDEEKYFLSFDPSKMEMILNNLLLNAFKFSNPGGKINIKISKHSKKSIPVNLTGTAIEWLCISVEDDGKGITKEESKHLFERFFSETPIKGIGVGLSLTKNLVELHKGHIIAESEPGVLTCFKIFLPLDEMNAIADYSITEKHEQLYITEDDISLLTDEHLTSEVDLPNTGSEDTYSILLVDDNPEVLDYLEMIFKNKYHVAKVENGIKALAYIKEKIPDLVISDLMMPEMDGIELCKSIKTDINISHIPLILLTSKSTIEDRLEGLQSGADDYIQKPFHPNILKVRVEKLIEAQKRQIEKLKANWGAIIPKNITKNPQDEKFLCKVIDSINTNMNNEDFSVEELGNMVFMSRSNLFRKLKAITGKTPIEFIYYVRIKRSMELLLERKLDISEISYEVGFKNHSSFTKSFKKQYGKSPSVFLNDILTQQKSSLGISNANSEASRK